MNEKCGIGMLVESCCSKGKSPGGFPFLFALPAVILAWIFHPV